MCDHHLVVWARNVEVILLSPVPHPHIQFYSLNFSTMLSSTDLHCASLVQGWQQ